MARAAADYAAGRVEAAEAGARAVLAQAPGRLGARHLFAACRLAAGALEEGAAALEAVVAAVPGRDEVRLQLAEVRVRQGRHGDAVALLGDVVARQPDMLVAYRPLAEAQWEMGARAAAIATWRELMARVPWDGAAQAALGEALRQAGEAAAAVPALRRALALLADRASALPAVRLCLAEVLAEVAMTAPPGWAELAEAAGLARAAMAPAKVDPAGDDPAGDDPAGDDPARLVRIAFVLHRAGDQAGAEACYAAALARDPLLADARLFLAMLRLVRGDFARGWPDYEWRRVQRPQDVAAGSPPARLRPPSAPWIAPARLDGVTVRVVLEQGQGDTLHFARYLPMLAARGGRVEMALASQAGVEPLLRAMPAVAAVVLAADSAPTLDMVVPYVVVPLLSLPLAFGTALGTIPAAVPYLTVPEDRQAVWRARLGAGDGRPRVGVVWWGSADHAGDRQRSIPLSRFRRVLERPGLSFHVLSDRLRGGERDELGALATVHEGVGDFADTAALAEMMDLVVTVDTSVAHLAGALGRPTWVLLPFLPDWRWLLGREDSPWYPTMRLFRQPAPGEWDNALARVGEALDVRFR